MHIADELALPWQMPSSSYAALNTSRQPSSMVIHSKTPRGKRAFQRASSDEKSGYTNPHPPDPNPKQAPGEAEDGSPYGQHQQQLKQLVEAASQARGG